MQKKVIPSEDILVKCLPLPLPKRKPAMARDICWLGWELHLEKRNLFSFLEEIAPEMMKLVLLLTATVPTPKFSPRI